MVAVLLVWLVVVAAGTLAVVVLLIHKVAVERDAARLRREAARLVLERERVARDELARKRADLLSRWEPMRARRR